MKLDAVLTVLTVGNSECTTLNNVIIMIVDYNGIENSYVPILPIVLDHSSLAYLFQV